jgi:hypothetical protein
VLKGPLRRQQRHVLPAFGANVANVTSDEEMMTDSQTADDDTQNPTPEWYTPYAEYGILHAHNFYSSTVL